AEKTARLDSILESLAELWAEGWIPLADFRRRGGFEREQIEYVLRRAVEDMPSSKDAWLQRAKYAKTVGDETTFISSRIRAVELAPHDIYLVCQVADDLCRYVTNAEIPVSRRNVYLASVRDNMVQVSKKLDATGLSRLAWLYLLEGSREEA